jgi:glucose-1-phosphate thymidylyltransferase
MKALITAGGKGTRLRPITYLHNKHLIPLANRPMIAIAIEKVAKAGVKDVVISINEGDDVFPKIVGDGSEYGVKITYVEQKGGALGLAHVVKNAKKYLQGDDFIFYLGDNILLNGLNDFVDKFYTDKLNCLLALSHVPDPQRFGVPVIKEGRIVEVLEKPENPPSDFAVAGIYIYDQNIFDVIENLPISARGEYEISDAHTALIKKGLKVGYAEITNWWKDTGKPQDLLEGNQLLLEQLQGKKILGKVENTVRLQGHILIEEGANIKGQSFLRGPLVIGKDTVIEDAYVGPFTSVGNQVVLKDVELEHSIIMDKSSIMTRERIVDSIIGCNVEISCMSDTLPRGHRIIAGDNSQIEI